MSKIIGECFEHVNDFQKKGSKSSILEKPVFFLIAGDLNTRTGSNIS